MVDTAAMAAHLRYSAWASKQLLDFAAGISVDQLLQEMGNSHGGILKTFQHIYYADRIWLSRAERWAATPFADPEPGPSLADLHERWFPLLQQFQQWAAQQNGDGILEFKNLKGEAYAKPISQVVLHVVNHGTYHRGQIAAMLRQLGHVPPSTDLIYFLDGARA
jgi:uncharacterized damage-inducible protein DinB